jgi:hypothetical protein
MDLVSGVRQHGLYLRCIYRALTAALGDTTTKARRRYQLATSSLHVRFWHKAEVPQVSACGRYSVGTDIGLWQRGHGFSIRTGQPELSKSVSPTRFASRAAKPNLRSGFAALQSPHKIDDFGLEYSVRNIGKRAQKLWCCRVSAKLGHPSIQWCGPSFVGWTG